VSALRVWAPGAQRVEVVIGARRLEMTAGAGGYWEVDAPEAAAGVDYAFAVDGGEPLPDPRSAWQPGGVHRASRVVDHGAFAWTDAKWRGGPLGAAVIYELHVGTFTPRGTFDAAIERLDHLVELGVTHVELMPVAEFPGDHGWGYDGVDLYAPHHAYGGPDGLKRLVDACHERGLAVILDVVYNHLGPSGSYVARFGPYFTRRHVTPWGEAVNLDGRGSDEVRRFFCDNAIAWLRDYHLDGLRVDAVHAIIDTSAVHFLEQLAAEVHALEARLGRHLIVIAESDLNDPRVVRAPEVGGYGMDAQWNEDFHHALYAMLTGERRGYYADFGRMADVAAAIERGFVYDGCYSRYRGRAHGRPASDLPGHRFVGCLQNHDQVGNRARGERLGHLVSSGLCAIGAALVVTSPFVPMLFQGEEWGASSPFLYFTDHSEPELAEAVRNGRRADLAAFGWDVGDVPDPQARETFERSKLVWAEREREPHAALLDWHRRLIRLRQTSPVLADGRPGSARVRYDEEARWLVVERGPLAVACNLGGQTRDVPVPGLAGARLLLAWQDGARVASGGLTLAGASVAVIER